MGSSLARATSSSLEFTHERCQEACRYSRAHILAREFWVCEKQRPVVWKEVKRLCPLSRPAAARLADGPEPGGHRLDALGVLGRHVGRLAEVVEEIVELIDGGFARLGGRVGHDGLARPGRDVLPRPLPEGEPAGVVDGVVAASGRIAKQGRQDVEAVGRGTLA